MATSGAPDGKLQIGIIGAGLAGLSLAYALSRSQHLDVHVYEGAEKLRPEGAAVGIGYNGQEAMRYLDPAIRQALNDAGGVTMSNPSVRFMMAVGPHEGEVVYDMDLKQPQITVHRYSLLQRFLGLLAPGVVVWSKKVDNITGDGPVTVTWTDGTTSLFDALIGCDGLNSICRQYVLSDQPDLMEAFTTGRYNFRHVVRMEEARKVLGEEYCARQTQYGWFGANGCFSLTDIEEDGKVMQVITGWSPGKPWPYDSPYVKWDAEKLKADLARDSGAIGEKLGKLITMQDPLMCAAARIHPITTTYSKASVCLVGDAAQGIAPALGAGAGQALEDAMVLTFLLSNSALTREDVPAALKAYSTIRVPRHSDVARGSLDMINIFVGERTWNGKQHGMDQLRRLLLGKWDWSQKGGFDFDETRQQAIAEFEKLRTR